MMINFNEIPDNDTIVRAQIALDNNREDMVEHLERAIPETAANWEKRIAQLDTMSEFLLKLWMMNNKKAD